MNNLFKILTAVLIIVLLLGAAVVIGGVAYLLPLERTSEAQQIVVWEESSQDICIGRLFTYENMFSILYAPVDPNSALECYVSYRFQENGNTLRSVDKELYENVSYRNPIILEFPREDGSIYELDVVIENKSGAVLHTSRMETYFG
jgi:hypothetical protein